MMSTTMMVGSGGGGGDGSGNNNSGSSTWFFLLHIIMEFSFICRAITFPALLATKQLICSNMYADCSSGTKEYSHNGCALYKKFKRQTQQQITHDENKHGIIIQKEMEARMTRYHSVTHTKIKCKTK